MSQPEIAATEMDARWLEWARPIVRASIDSPDHLQWCRSRLGQAEYDDLDPTLRWPGYIGSQWERGEGVLFIGSVHSDFHGIGGDATTKRPTVAELAEANRRWRDDDDPTPAADLAYLTATRSAYATLIPHWPRGAVFRGLLESVFGEKADPFAHAAWTNLAHCRARPGKTPSGEYPLQQACSSDQGQFPIGALTSLLCPRVIICSVAPFGGRHRRLYDLTRPDDADWPPGYDGPILRAYNGSRRPQGGAWNGQPAVEWINDLVRLLRDRADRDF